MASRGIRESKQVLLLLLILSTSCAAAVVKTRSSELTIVPEESFLLFQPKSTFKVGVQLNIPLDEPFYNIYRGLLFRGDYHLPSYNMTPGVVETRSVHRWSLYSSLEQILDRVNAGRGCLLLAVCEAATKTLQHDGIWGAIIHIFLTPSSSNERASMTWQRAYKRAENWGSKGGNCFQKYGDLCPSGALQHFTSLHSTD